MGIALITGGVPDSKVGKQPLFFYCQFMYYHLSIHIGNDTRTTANGLLHIMYYVLVNIVYNCQCVAM